MERAYQNPRFDNSPSFRASQRFWDEYSSVTVFLRVEKLPDMQKSIFFKMLSGDTAKTISIDLNVSQRTVEKHCEAISIKLSLVEPTFKRSSMKEILIRYSFEAGIAGDDKYIPQYQKK